MPRDSLADRCHLTTSRCLAPIHRDRNRSPALSSLIPIFIMNSSPPESPEGNEKPSEAPSSPPTPTTSLPSSYVADNQKVDDSSKLRTFLSILRKYATALTCLPRSTASRNPMLILSVSIDLSASQTLHRSGSLCRRSSLSQLQTLVSGKLGTTCSAC